METFAIAPTASRTMLVVPVLVAVILPDPDAFVTTLRKRLER